VPPKATPKDGEELLRQLVQNKHLTKFQAQEIYQGRGKSLLLGNYTLIDKIGAEIGQEGARVLVVGHTDNVPINTFAFRSNWQLSQERARQVARILGRHISPALIRAEGRGETEPADTDDTPEGREANRRTELIVIQPQPGSTSWTSLAGTTPPAPGSTTTPMR
jgi:flagellar motor protein MotB